MSSGFSVFKQKVWNEISYFQFAEFFDKDKKTVDEVLERKLKLIAEFESEIKNYFRAVDLFSYNIVSKSLMSSDLALIECHHSMALTL